LGLISLLVGLQLLSDWELPLGVTEFQTKTPPAAGNEEKIQINTLKTGFLRS
jgi:hypothetical protein